MKRQVTFSFVAALALLTAACGQGEEVTTAATGSSSSGGDQSHSSATSGASAPDACTAVTEQEIASLFDRWNEDLASGDPKRVVENYAQESILIPTVSNKVRLTPDEKQDYFTHWLEKGPSGVVNERWIELDCNRAVDAGVYTFTYADGSKVAARYTFVYGTEGDEWKILTHHSSAMPQPGADTELPPAESATGSPKPALDPKECASASEADVVREFTDWGDAMSAGDAAKVTEHYAENALVLPFDANELLFSNGEHMSYFKSFVEKKPQVKADKRWTSIDCNTATDSGLYTVTFADGNTVDARFTFTYRWQDGGWQVSSQHSSLMPEGAPAH